MTLYISSCLSLSPHSPLFVSPLFFSFSFFLSYYLPACIFCFVRPSSLSTSG